MSKEVYFGLFGCGAIGSAVIKHLDRYSGRVGEYQFIPKVIYEPDDSKLAPLKNLRRFSPRIAKSKDDIIMDDGIKIVVELTGTDIPAFNIITEANCYQKDVVTANKLALAKHWSDIFDNAKRCQREVRYEACVGGGVTELDMLKDNMDYVKSSLSIANGTGNFILTKMEKMGKKSALKIAQKKGYVESDPTMDLEGFDSANKNIILAAHLHGVLVDFDLAMSKLYRDGIQDIDRMDIDYARTFGYKIKLLNKTRMKNGELEFGTYPKLIDGQHILACVNGVNNGFYIDFKNKHPQMYYGEGAGPDPTKMAVIEDMVRIAGRGDGEIRIPHIYNKKIKKPENVVCPWYIRVRADDRPGTLSKISGLLGKYGVSISKVIQEGRGKDGNEVPIFMLIHDAKTRNVYKAVEEIKKLRSIKGNPVTLRVENCI